jgi:nitrite reductase/ring-hydroxylating ferredoxin subunit
MEVVIASTRDIPIGKMKGIVSGGKEILIANLNGEYYAMGNICTHEGCTISGGTLKGDRVQCPCHGSTFDIKTGAVIAGPAQNPEPSFKVRVESGQILLIT